MAQQFLIQGRIVFGHPSKPREKRNAQTKQPVIKDGHKVMQYLFGVAIDKAQFNSHVWPALSNEARAAFPNGVPPAFSYKFKDGDSVDSKGQPYAKREGYAGHCVLAISTEGFAPQVFKNENGTYRQLAENEIKCGDYVAVNVTVKYNGVVSPNTPGLYINPNGVVLIGYGQEIQSAGQDPDELFAGMQPQQFQGMTAQPTLAPGAMPGQMMSNTVNAPYTPQPGGGPVAAPYTPAAPQYAPQPQQYVQQPEHLPAPAHDFVRNATGQPITSAPPAGAGYPQQGYPATNVPAQPQQYVQQPVAAQPQQYVQQQQPNYAPAPAAGYNPGAYPGAMPPR